MTLVAISGSHQVGKTTAIDAVRDHVGVAGNVMRSLIQAGIGVARETTPETIQRYVRAQLASERRAGSEHAIVVSDRVLLDGLAYVEAAVRRNEAAYPWSETELTLLRAAARLHASSYDMHVFIPIEFPCESDQPFHAGGEEFRRQVSDAIEEHLADDWPAPVVIVRGSHAQREASIRAALAIDG